MRIEQTARDLFGACETGGGREACRRFRHDGDRIAPLSGIRNDADALRQPGWA